MINKNRPQEEYIPICNDPSVPRAFKGVTQYNEDGTCKGTFFPKFDSTVMPKKEELDLTLPVNLADPLNYAAIISNNDNVDIGITPSADALGMAQLVSDSLKS